MQKTGRALELQPNLVVALWSRLLAACYLGRWEESFGIGQKLASITRRSAYFLGLLAMAHGMAGQREKALTLRQELLDRQELGEHVSPNVFLAVDVGLNDMETVLKDLAAYLEDGGNGWAIEMFLGGNLDKLAAHAAHPACAELRRRMGLPT